MHQDHSINNLRRTPCIYSEIFCLYFLYYSIYVISACVHAHTHTHTHIYIYI